MGGRQMSTLGTTLVYTHRGIILSLAVSIRARGIVLIARGGFLEGRDTGNGLPDPLRRATESRVLLAQKPRAGTSELVPPDRSN